MNRPLLGMLVALTVTGPARAGDYVLTINDMEIDVGLGEPTTAELPDGTTLRLALRQKEYVSYRSDLFSFEHLNKYKPGTNDVGAGVNQTIVVTPFGTGIIVQEYATMDPSTLVDAVLQEVTKQETEYGFEYEESEVSIPVGEVALKGKRAVTTHGDEQWTRTVVSYGKKDRGVLVLTFIESKGAHEKDIIDHFWETFQLDEGLR